jgi:methylenetetrahydrofolate dehydrogenase (NADP+)/methenyltetrahydrofolate cyclohydrolase
MEVPVGEILDGKAIGEALRERVAAGVRAFSARAGRVPGLDVILVGEDAASSVYVRNKAKSTEAAGMRGAVHRLPADTTEAALLALVRELDDRDDVDGILVQLPLPKHIDADRVLDAIVPSKDVDGFHPLNAGLLMEGRPGLVPCTPWGCMRLLEHGKIDVAGKHAVVIGRSNIVGKPAAMLLLQRSATVTIAHSKTRDLPELCRTADILVAAVGRAEMVRGDWVKPGAVVLDVGINRTADGKLVGDVAFHEARQNASWITPVPGGVGPMTIACLLENTLRAAWAREGFPLSELPL